MVIPYLVFQGNCKEVLEFYKKVFDCEIRASMPYGDYIPEGIENPPADLHDWILHAEMQICGTTFWFADDLGASEKGNVVRLSAIVSDKKEGQQIFDQLKENGTITLPPTETFYSTFHGALIDRFGVGWNVVAEEAPKQE